MRLLISLLLGTLGVLLILLSPLLALAGGVWDAMALGIGDVISGPDLADRLPSGVLLIGIPIGAGLLVAGWRIGRSEAPKKVARRH